MRGAILRARPTSRFFRVRVTLLLAILVGVLVWAGRDVRSRRQRKKWERPLSIAVVLVRQGPIDEQALEAFRLRMAALDSRLTDEYRRYRADKLHPFVMVFVGPVDAVEPPPGPRDGTDGNRLLASAWATWAMWRWTSRIDRRAGLSADGYDSRIYVAARPPARQGPQMVEGESQEGGRVGVVEVDLDASMADFALFVVAHELLHTLGATDKYGPDGRTLIPLGLAQPDRIPRWPQRFAEVMARNRPVAPTFEVPPENLDDLAVGPETAREIGWIR